MNLNQPYYYQLATDVELATLLFTNLRQHQIKDFYDLETKLKQLEITSFNELKAYLMGPKADPAIAKTVAALVDRWQESFHCQEESFTSSAELGAYLISKLRGQKQEQFWALYLNNQNCIIAEKLIFQGTVNKVDIHPREVFRWAVVYECSSIIVAHNHPSGHVMPSAADIATTKKLKKAADLLNIRLLDHFVLGKDDYFSFQEHDLG
jgi:DNA repair protein RadC